MANTQQQVLNTKDQVTGILSFATSHHIGLHHLPQILRQFSDLYPNAILDIHFLDSEQAYERLLLGKIEFALITLAPTSPDGIEHHPLWHDPLHFVISPNHPLASQQEQLNLSILSQSPAILPDLSTYTGRIIEKLFDQHQIELQTSMSSNYLETIKMMVAVGLGWSVLPTTLLDQDLISINIDQIALSRTLGYITARQRTLSKAGQAFISLLEAEKELKLS